MTMAHSAGLLQCASDQRANPVAEHDRAERSDGMRGHQRVDVIAGNRAQHALDRSGAIDRITEHYGQSLAVASVEKQKASISLRILRRRDQHGFDEVVEQIAVLVADGIGDLCRGATHWNPNYV